MKKPFFVVILGIIIVGWFVIGKPLVEWHDEIANLSHRIHNILESDKDEYDNLMALPNAMTTSSDFVQASLRADMRLRKIYSLNKQIAGLFEQKPLGLPLTTDEQADYASVKRSIARHENPKASEASTSEPASITPPAPLPLVESPKPTATPVQYRYFLNESVTVKIDYGSMTVPAKTEVTLVRDNSRYLIVRALGHDIQIQSTKVTRVQK